LSLQLLPFRFGLLHSMPLRGAKSFFKENSIQQDGRSKNDSLLSHSRFIWKSQFKCISIRKDFRYEWLWFFQNLTHKRSIPSSIGLCGWIDTEWYFATAPATAGVAFSAAIDTNSTTARGLMNLVNWVSSLITRCKGRDTIPAIFLECSKDLTAWVDGNFLVAAALAAADGATTWPIDGYHLSVGVEFLYFHSKGVVRADPETAATIWIFNGMRHLRPFDKVLEFSPSFTSKDFLTETSTSLGVIGGSSIICEKILGLDMRCHPDHPWREPLLGCVWSLLCCYNAILDSSHTHTRAYLANFHFGDARDMTLECIGTAVHFLAHGDGVCVEDCSLRILYS